jgi:hypothetical protein
MAIKGIFIASLILLCAFSSCKMTQAAKRNYIMTYEEEKVEESGRQREPQPCQGVEESLPEAIETQTLPSGQIVDL